MIYSNNLKNVDTKLYHSSFFKQNLNNDFIIEGEEIITLQPNSGDIVLGELSTDWFINTFLTGLVVKTDDIKYPDSVFFFKEDKCYFELENNGTLWCDYNNIRLIFYDKYGYNWLIYRQFIKSVVEEHFKSNNVTPIGVLREYFPLVEEHFKSKNVIPRIAMDMRPKWVEEHFKSMTITPSSQASRHSRLVEDHFKSKSIIPEMQYLDIKKQVEDHFKSKNITPRQSSAERRESVENNFNSMIITLAPHFQTKLPLE